MKVTQEFINKWNKHDVSFLNIEQAGATVDEFLQHAINAIDSVFGKGFAKKNPALVLEYVKAAIANLAVIRQDDQAYRQAKQIEHVSDSIDRLAFSASGISSAIEQASTYSQIDDVAKELSSIDSSLSCIDQAIETGSNNLHEISENLARLVSIKPASEA